VDIPSLGAAPIIITPEGRLLLDLSERGKVVVSTTENGFLTAFVPDVGRVLVAPWVPSRSLVYVPGFGVNLFTVEKSGRPTIHISGWGTRPVQVVNGVLTTAIPSIGTVQLRGLTTNTLPPMVDCVKAERLGYFPIFMDLSGNSVVSIPGHGEFTVDIMNGAEVVTIPELGKLSVVYQSRTAIPGAGYQVLKVNDPSSSWVWSASDASVYLLQQLDSIRPEGMAPETFLRVINSVISESVQNLSLKDMTPEMFARGLFRSLQTGGYVQPSSMVESIGEHMKTALTGPFPPFEDILEHIYKVVGEE